MPTIVITLEIDGTPADAAHVVDRLLDAGFLQDAINGHDCDAGPLRVRVATSSPSPEDTRIILGLDKPQTEADRNLIADFCAPVSA